MESADDALIEAWTLSIEDPTDEVDKRLDELLPALIQAGYAESEPASGDYYVWNFTDKGIAQAEKLVPDEDLD